MEDAPGSSFASPGRPLTRESVGRAGPLLLISASILLQELYWLRVFAEIEWGHVASIVVSTAMLGIGAGSVGVQLAGARADRHARSWWRASLVSTVLALAVVPWILARLPFEAMLLAWRFDAWAWLLLREILVALPLATATAAVTLALRVRKDRPGRTWGIHLLGAGAGVAVGLALMMTRPTAALLFTALATSAGAAVWSLLPASMVSRRGLGVVTVLLGMGIGAIAPGPPLSSTKDLHALNALPQARVIEEKAGAEGPWKLLTAPSLHGTSGASLQGPVAWGEQRAIVVRGDHVGSVIEAASADVLRARVAWLPYALRPLRSVLVVQDAGSLEAQAARLAGASEIVVNLTDARTLRALRDELGTFAGLEPSAVDLRHDAPRALLAAGIPPNSVDLVVLPPHDSLAMATGGLGSTLELPLLTIDALLDAWLAMAPDGQLAISRWTLSPPRELAKLLLLLDKLSVWQSTLLDERVALVRSWDAWCLTVSGRPFTPAERRALVQFALKNGFDVLLPVTERTPPRHAIPGTSAVEVIDRWLAGEPLDVGGLAGLDLRTPTDDRPWFQHFLSWSAMATVLSPSRDAGAPPSDWGDFFLAGSLASSLALGAGILVLPVLLSREARRVATRTRTPALLLLCLGLGYMLIEMLWLHVGSFVLEETTVVASVVIAAFLLGSGSGSLLFARGPRRGARAAAIVTLAALVITFALGSWRSAVLTWPLAARWAAVFVSAFMIAVPMGLPLPSALAAVRFDQVAWLLALNAWASVLGPGLGTLLAIQLGVRGLGFVSACVYGLAALLLLRLSIRAGHPGVSSPGN